MDAESVKTGLTIINELKDMILSNLTAAGKEKVGEKINTNLDMLASIINGNSVSNCNGNAQGNANYEAEILKRLRAIEGKLDMTPKETFPDKVITHSRASHRLFHGSHLLSGANAKFQKILNQWYGVPKQSWRCIFRAQTHNFSADSFHRHCDNFAPTFTIILGHNGDLCGGFTDIPWSIPADPKGRYITSEKSFLFSLINRESTDPIKFDVIKKRFAIVHHQRYGPIFGGGADLALSDNCDANMESYSNLPHSYDGEHANNYILMGHYYFCVKDYEVFTIT